MKKDNDASSGAEKSQGLRNILRMIFLIAVLTGAWFLLDWLINVN